MKVEENLNKKWQQNYGGGNPRCQGKVKGSRGHPSEGGGVTGEELNDPIVKFIKKITMLLYIEDMEQERVSMSLLSIDVSIRTHII